MRQRNDSTGVFDSLNSRYAGYSQHVAFLQPVRMYQAQRVRVREAHVTDGDGAAVGGTFGAGRNEVDFGGGC
jgi:hypothetical protein